MNPWVGLSFLVVSSLASGCSATRSGAQREDQRARPESLTSSNVLFVADAHLQTTPEREPQLVVLLRTTNLADSTLTLSSQMDNCEPAFELENLGTGRHFLWSHVAWRRKHEPLNPPPINDVACIGTGLILTLAPRGHGELGRQVYPVAMIRGDSVPSGRYRVRVPAVLDDTGAVARLTTIRVWSGSVTLP